MLLKKAITTVTDLEQEIKEAAALPDRRIIDGHTLDGSLLASKRR